MVDLGYKSLNPPTEVEFSETSLTRLSRKGD
jgi:hypothetical protein